LDNFDRVNQGPPPSASWSALGSAAGGLKVVSNQCIGNSTVNYYGNYYNAATYGPDTEVYATSVNMGTGDCDAELEGRLTNPGNGATVAGYNVDLWPGGGVIVVAKISGGVYTQIGASFSHTYTVGEKFGMTITGSATTTIEVFYNTGSGWISL